MRDRMIAALIVFAVVCGGVTTASATTLTFDDIAADEIGVIPSGYGGLDWGNMAYVRATTYEGGDSGYNNGRASGEYVAFNSTGGPADVLEISSAGTFDFNSTYLTAAWRDGMSIQVRGYNDGALLYDQTVVVDTYFPTLFTFNFLGVDRLNFTSFGGVRKHPGKGFQFAMDDFTFNAPQVPVPEPASLILLGTGVAALLRRRLKKARAA